MRGLKFPAIFYSCTEPNQHPEIKKSLAKITRDKQRLFQKLRGMLRLVADKTKG
jgi:hypothetical protein